MLLKCSAELQQFGDTDVDESPICAMDGALRAVASLFHHLHQNILEALRSVAWNNEEYVLCNLPIPKGHTIIHALRTGHQGIPKGHTVIHALRAGN